MHRYQRVIFDGMERQRGAQRAGPAVGWTADVDGDRRGLPNGAPGRGVAGGPPALVVAEHGASERALPLAAVDGRWGRLKLQE
jgi:hypothetical protein